MVRYLPQPTIKKTKIYIIPYPKHGFEVKWTCPRGEKIVKDGLYFLQDVEIVKKPKDADYYFLIYRPHYNSEMTTKAIEKFYGPKLVVIDWIDEPHYTVIPTDKCLAYFKRSMAVPYDETGIKKYLPTFQTPNVYGIAYALMPEFVYHPIKSWDQKDWQIGCFLRDTCQSRINVLYYTSQICELTKTYGYIGPPSEASRSDGTNCIFDNAYLSCLSRTKFNITCNPTLWEGDSRYWESLANGCLTFVDRTITPYPDRLTDGIHHVEYSLDNPQELADKVVYYLNNPAYAERIASTGRRYALEWHSPVARMRYVINTLNKIKENNVLSHDTRMV